jgi:hypothetical protein
VGVGYFASHCCGGEYWEVAIGPVKRGEDIDVVRSVELAEIICHDQQLVRSEVLALEAVISLLHLSILVSCSVRVYRRSDDDFI